MNSWHPLRWLWLTLAAVFLALLSIVITAGMQVPGGASKPDVKTTGGLTVVTFAVDPGKITVKLPDDVRAGDTISGTVTTEPKGNTAEEEAKSQKELNGYVLDLEGTKVHRSVHTDGQRLSAGLSTELAKGEVHDYRQKHDRQYLRLRTGM